MADLLVAGAFLSASLQVLFDRLAPKEIPKFFRGNEPIADLLRDLRTAVKSAKKLVNDAEEKQIADDDVREWLDELNDVVYRADDLADTVDSEALRQKAEGEKSGGKTGFDDAVKNEATEILCRLKSLVEQKDGLGLREGVEKPLNSRTSPAPLAEEASVFGRKGDKEAVVDLLLRGDGTDDKISVVPIVGMGGIGKTTLARLVYDDDRVENHFDVRASVTVSDDFDVFEITKAILEKVASEECRIGDLFEVQLKLREALRRKRFLLVLDDVWNENYHLWDCLKSCFESGADGSKIVATTRSAVVASVMAVGKATYRLTDLSTEDCWRLFAKHAFGNDSDPDAHRDLKAIGREIVEKCKGLPLAIKSLGGLLRSERNPKKWENILRSDVWDEFYKKEGNILPALWLSYRHMPAHLKRCFSYCSIFPKDHEFRKERTILLWMAEGFLQSDDKLSTTMEELGEEYFDDLLSRSLFHKSGQDDSIFVMHDLVHDLARFVSGKLCFRLDESNNLRNLASQTRYLSYSHKSTEFEGICNAKYLRTFVRLPHENYSSASQPRHELLLTIGRCLRVLCLLGSCIKELPSSIGNLTHLRYLDLSYCGIKKLHDSVCSLYNLQTLLLFGCRSLTALPDDMERLINLRHLDIEEVPLKEMTFQIKNMKSLRTLNKLVVGDGDKGPKINELKGVQPFLRGRLEISRLESVGDAKEALESNLNDKKGVTDVSLIWSYGSASSAYSSEREREILDSLRPHTNVRRLAIEFYRGTTFPDWVGHDSFSNIVSICLIDCKSCCFLPPLGQLFCLKELEIAGFDSVVRVGDEFYGRSSSASPSFKCLESLKICYMPMLKEWSLGGEGRVAFPRLAALKLNKCPELISIGLTNKERPRTAFPRLVSLTVYDCPGSVQDSLLGFAPLAKLKQFSASKCERLFQCCDLKRLSSLELIKISEWEGESFPPDGFLPASLTWVSIIDCRNLVALNGKAFQQLTCLKSLFIVNCPRLRCLPEEGLPASLYSLWVGGCCLLKQRYEKDIGEAWPKIAHIPKVFLIS